MTRISADWIERAETQAVCAVLEDAGYRALFVGGCVRNALLGEPVNDIDLATDAPPDITMQVSEAAGLRAVPTGIDHGTITVVSDGLAHEITTFRRDVETTGRHATVAFTDQIEEDARRRDFTMNALYADRTGEIIDPLDGLSDLRGRRIRFIEDPEARIHEDYLRILRFFRFHAWYGDPSAGLDPEGLAACAANCDGLDSLSKERIGVEMLKLLSATDPAPSVAAMERAGCLNRVLPGAEAKTLPVLLHLEQIAGVTPNPIRRLASLGGQNLTDNLRLSKTDARRVNEIRDGALGDQDLAELAYRHDAELALDAGLLRAALLESPLPENAKSEIELGASAIFPVAAKDLIEMYQGETLGAKLRELESKWIASRFTASRDELLGNDA